MSVSTYLRDTIQQGNFGIVLWHKIGKGTFGDVSRVELYLTPDDSPIMSIIEKHYKKGHYSTEGIAQDVARETRGLYHASQRCCRHIVKMFDTAVERTDCGYNFSTYLEDMEYSLLQFEKLGQGEAIKVMIGLCTGLLELNSMGFMHRDLKPGNCLLKKGKSFYDSKIADLGTLRHVSTNVDGRCYTAAGDICTLQYRPIDSLLGNIHYGKEFDIWSLGCIHGQLRTGKVMFHTSEGSEYSQIVSIFREIGYPSDESIEYLKGLKSWRKEFLENRSEEGTFFHPDGMSKTGKRKRSNDVLFDEQERQLLMQCFEMNPNKRITTCVLLELMISMDEEQEENKKARRKYIADLKKQEKQENRNIHYDEETVLRVLQVLNQREEEKNNMIQAIEYTKKLIIRYKQVNESGGGENDAAVTCESVSDTQERLKKLLSVCGVSTNHHNLPFCSFKEVSDGLLTCTCFFHAMKLYMIEMPRLSDLIDRFYQGQKFEANHVIELEFDIERISRTMFNDEIFNE